MPARREVECVRFVFAVVVAGSVLCGGVPATAQDATRAIAVEPQDHDGDQHPDDEDLCPDQPEDMDGFEDDDGCPDLDNDRDGVVDGLDLCPEVAEDPDGFEDDDGCPDPDNDDDGIPDDDDLCPNEPARTLDRFGDGCPSDDR